MVALDTLDYERLILNYLRWKLTDPGSRGSEATETFNGTGAQVTFTLAHAAAKYIGAVTITAVAKNYMEHFTIDLKDSGTVPTVTFRTAPESGTNNVSITYGYGSSWVLPFLPEVDATMPIISLKKITSSSNSLAAGNPGRWYRPVYQVGIHCRRGKKYTIGGEAYSGAQLASYLSGQIYTQLQNAGLGELYQLNNCNLDSDAWFPYDKEDKTIGIADSYSFKFAQRF